MSSSKDKTIRFWDNQTGSMIQELQTHSSVSHLNVSPGGNCMAYASANDTVCVGNARNREAMHVLKPNAGEIKSVIFSHSGVYIITCTSTEIQIWGCQTGETVGNPLKLISGATSAVFSPDSQRIVFSSWGRNVSISDARTRTDLASPQSTANSSMESCRARWNVACSQLDYTDGWVKDEGKLLFWVPVQYREDIRNSLVMDLGRGERKTLRPVVNLQTLLAYSGSRWTDIYEPHA